jgi:hypothetical protein
MYHSFTCIRAYDIVITTHWPTEIHGYLGIFVEELVIIATDNRIVLTWLLFLNMIFTVSLIQCMVATRASATPLRYPSQPKAKQAC